MPQLNTDAICIISLALVVMTCIVCFSVGFTVEIVVKHIWPPADKNANKSKEK